MTLTVPMVPSHHVFNATNKCVLKVGCFILLITAMVHGGWLAVAFSSKVDGSTGTSSASSILCIRLALSVGMYRMPSILRDRGTTYISKRSFVLQAKTQAQIYPPV